LGTVVFGAQLIASMIPAWNSSVAGGTTLRLRFPFQLKARLFCFLCYGFCVIKNDLAFCWNGKHNGSAVYPSTGELHDFSVKETYSHAQALSEFHW